MLYPGINVEDLRKMTSEFEKRQFQVATGLQDYITYIADGLTVVENSVNNHFEELQAVANGAAAPSTSAPVGHVHAGDVNTNIGTVPTGGHVQAPPSHPELYQEHGSSQLRQGAAPTSSASANAAGTAGPSQLTKTDWRDSLTTEERIEICRFIMDTLAGTCI